MRKARKLSWLEILGITGLGALKLASTASAQEAKPVENPAGTVPYSQNSNDSVKAKSFNNFLDGLVFSVDTTFATDYVFSSGAIIGREKPGDHRGVNQTLFNLGKDSVFTDRDNVSLWSWTNLNFADAETGNGLDELDVGIAYTLPVTKDISVVLGCDSWNYPNKLQGEHGDRLVNARVFYKGPVDLEAWAYHLMAHEDTDNGEFYLGKISKTFPLYESEHLDVLVTPSFAAGFTDNFYGAYGNTARTPGIAFDINGENDEPFCQIFVNFQDGKKGNDDITYAGVSFQVYSSDEK